MPTLAELVDEVHAAKRVTDLVHRPDSPMARSSSSRTRDAACLAERVAVDALRDHLIAHYPDPGQGEPWAVVLADGTIVTYHVGTVTLVRPENVHRSGGEPATTAVRVADDEHWPDDGDLPAAGGGVRFTET
jgi:hypothetical protein